MTEQPFDNDEFFELLGAVRDEQITPEQVARLEQIISQNAEARRQYIRFLIIHGLLEQTAVAIPANPSAVTMAEAATRPLSGGKRRLRLWPLAAAAALLLAVSAWWLLSGDRDQGNIVQPVARLVPSWKVTPTGQARFEQVTPTSLKLEHGEVRIEAIQVEAQGQDAPRDFMSMTVATPAGRVTVDGSDFLVGAHELAHSQEKGEGMKYFTRVLVLAGVATLINPHGSITGEADSLLAAPADQAPVKQAVEANAGLAVDMYRQLLKQKSEPNLFFSPYSISLALAMTAEGTRGQTAAEMGKVLHFPDVARRVGDDAQLIPWHTALIHSGFAQLSRNLAGAPKKDTDRHELRIANALWGDQRYPFRQQFVETLKGAYDVGAVQPCDFMGNSEKERQRINGWVADQTNKRIEDLLPPGSVNKLTRLVLTNAVYFKADWLQKFDKRSTRPTDFFTLAGSHIKTPMMSGSFEKARFAFIGTGDAHKSLTAGTADNFRLVELPYRGGLSMVLIAPDNVRGLPALETKLTTQSLANWLGRLRAEDKVEVTMPRFKFLTEYRLADALKQLGMVRAFLPPGPDGADFSGMSESGARELYVSGVYHKAFVAVNEEGTEAAAATGVAVRLGGSSKPPQHFLADRPFLFLIRDPASGTILFMGRVTDPTGVANNDRSERQEAGIKLARTAPTKHPLYQRLKDAAGVAIIRAYRHPSGNMELKGDATGRTLLQCRVALPLKGELKADSLPWLTIERKVEESEAGQAFGDFISKSFGQVAVLAVYERQGDQLIVQEIVELDEEAMLIVAALYSIPMEKLSNLVNRR